MMSDSIGNMATLKTLSHSDLTSQNVTFFAADGVPVTVSISKIDAWRKLLVVSSISISAQIGAAIIMFAVHLMVTNAKKRKTPIFWLNSAALLVSIVSNLLLATYYPSGWTEFYEWFTSDPNLPSGSAVNTSITANVFGPIYLLTIELSLFLQMHVVCIVTTDRYRWAIMIIGFLVASAAVGFNFGQMVMNCKATLDANYYSNPAWKWIGRAVDVTYTVSIWYFCLIFVWKIGVTMYTRRKMKMKQWGPMRIIFTMGGCTMIIPSIFSVLEFWSSKFVWEPGTIGHTLVAIFLPLSSILSSTTIEGFVPSDARPEIKAQQFFASDDSTPLRTNAAPLNDHELSAIARANRLRREGLRRTPLSFSPLSVEGEDEVERESGGVVPDGGFLANDSGIEVERTYSVRSSRGLEGQGRH